MTASRAPLDPGLVAGRRTAHELVRETLRYAILRRRLPGGAHLVQAEIAAELGVSITPVREALRDLATEGLVRLDPHRGAVVVETSADELAEIVRLRTMLEVDLARRAAAAMDGATLDAARAVHERMTRTPDAGEWAALNRELHLTLYRAARRERLFEMVRSLIDASLLFVRVAQDERALRARADGDHARLLELMAARDPDGVAALLARHIRIPLDGG